MKNSAMDILVDAVNKVYNKHIAGNVIGSDQISDLIIALHTTKSVEEFLSLVERGNQ